MSVWRFKGNILKGDPNRLVELPESYLGPIISPFNVVLLLLSLRKYSCS